MDKIDVRNYYIKDFVLKGLNGYKGVRFYLEGFVFYSKKSGLLNLNVVVYL